MEGMSTWRESLKTKLSPVLAGAELIFFPEFPEAVGISWIYSAEDAHKRLVPEANLIICKE